MHALVLIGNYYDGDHDDDDVNVSHPTLVLGGS